MREKGEEGQAVVLVALAMGVFLLGAVGLAVDGSHLYSQRQMAQSAADSAAIAGIMSIFDGMAPAQLPFQREARSFVQPQTQKLHVCMPSKMDLARRRQILLQSLFRLPVQRPASVFPPQIPPILSRLPFREMLIRP